MTEHDLQRIANTVVQRAKHQGYIIPRDIQADLAQAGPPRAKWKDVVALAPESLCYRQGRYYYVTPVSLPRQEELSKIQIVAHIVRRIIDRHQAHTAQRERRQQDRI